jgi:hypothetical protein
MMRAGRHREHPLTSRDHLVSDKHLHQSSQCAKPSDPGSYPLLERVRPRLVSVARDKAHPRRPLSRATEQALPPQTPPPLECV